MEGTPLRWDLQQQCCQENRQKQVRQRKPDAERAVASRKICGLSGEMTMMRIPALENKASRGLSRFHQPSDAVESSPSTNPLNTVPFEQKLLELHYGLPQALFSMAPSSVART
jgi:hypothetical protein